MGDGKVIGRGIGGFGILVGEWRVGIVDDLAVAMVLHHDDEDMVQMPNSLGYWALGGIQIAYQDCGQKTNCGLAFHIASPFLEGLRNAGPLIWCGASPTSKASRV